MKQIKIQLGCMNNYCDYWTYIQDCYITHCSWCGNYFIDQKGFEYKIELNVSKNICITCVVRCKQKISDFETYNDINELDDLL
jgi:hypothetical protein